MSIGAPKGDPLSVMVITEEGICPCQPMPIAVSLRTRVRIRKASPMSLRELFAFIGEHRRSSTHQSTEEEGAQISRRVVELLAVPAPTHEIEAPFTKACGENDPTCYCEVGRLHGSWSQQGTYAGHPCIGQERILTARMTLFFRQ